MKLYFSISLILLLFVFASCEFSETMVLQNNGSGTMTIKMDASDVIKMVSTMKEEGENIKSEDKLDTTFYFKEFLAQNKDSIRQLSEEQQQKLQKLEPYGIHIKMDAEEGILNYDVFLEFNSITEANNMFDVFNQIGKTGVNTSSEANTSLSQKSIKVTYSFENFVFKRDAYIADKELYQQEMDSLKNIEMMLSGSHYKLNYTFPSKIKSTTQPDANLSQDRKTLFYQVEYLDFLKNPDLMDIEVVLE
ncbi:hypothetical protein [Planktosalinus lacus]|nr:hypothetical protein [Planktosalinus lacus]